MKKAKRLIVLMLCLSTILSNAACGNKTTQEQKLSSNKETTAKQETPAEQGKSVKLKVGESYTVQDVKDEDVDYDWKYSSDNKDVAYVIGNKYIRARSPGTAKITASKGNNTEIYSVTVTESENQSDRLLKVTDVKDESVYLGAGYNAFASDEYITNKQLIMGNGTLIKSNIISEEYGDDDTIIRCEKTNVDQYMYIQGNTSEQYAKNYEQTIKGKLNVNVKDIVSGNVSGKFVDSSKESKIKKKMYTTVFSYNQKYQYILNAEEEQLRAMAQQNKKAWKMLTGVNGATPEEVFEKYGTHIITQAVIGGRMELDYTITANDSSTTSDELLNIAGGLDLKIAMVKGSAEASYNQETLKEIKNKNCSISTTVRTYGGNMTSASLITDLESFTNNYPTWYDSINDDTLTFIGTTQYGLLPIWDLLPEDEAGIERRNALITYYKERMSQKNADK